MKHSKVLYGVVGLLVLIFFFGSCNNTPPVPLVILTLNAQGGSEASPSTKEVTIGSEYGTLGTTTRAGYTFGGWWDELGGAGDVVTSATIVDEESDHTLYAKWTPKTYTVTFDAQGGTALSSESKQVTFSETYGTLPTVEKQDKVFRGWWTEPFGYGQKVTGDTVVMITGDQVLYAHWNTYIGVKITFKLNKGTTSDPTSKTVAYNGPYGELPIVTRYGYTFVYWAKDDYGSEKIITPATIVTNSGEHEVYAKWEPNTYTVSFDAQGGNPSSFPSRAVTSDQPYGDLPSIVRDHHDFLGWRHPSGALVRSTDIFLGEEDLILKAGWEFVPFVGPAGGTVFYENPNHTLDGWTYLEAAPYGWFAGSTDSAGAYSGGDDPVFQWGAQGWHVLPSALDLEVGTGEQNTANIVMYHDSLFTDEGSVSFYTDPTDYHANNDGFVAAKECADYSVLHGGVTYDDWFLPSRDELGVIFDVLIFPERLLEEENRIYGYSQEARYWSSSDSSFSSSYVLPHSVAWSLNTHLNNSGGYSYGYREEWTRSLAFRVRPIRSY